MSAPESPGLIRRHVVYHGHVQGVFFRATSAELSRGFRVTGHVRNLRDGTVELEAQGPPDQVTAFLDAVARHFRGHITRTDVEERSVVGGEAAFEVRYG